MIVLVVLVVPVVTCVSLGVFMEVVLPTCGVVEHVEVLGVLVLCV